MAGKAIGDLFSKGMGALPWNLIFVDLWSFIKKGLQRIVSVGMVEVLDYVATLELKDGIGQKSTFHKYLKVRYLQDNIIAFQDFAWGDGEILLNYHCSPGKAVDRYRSGFKTYVLLSLRQIKNSGDVDEFNMRWNIRDGFLTEDGYWGADVSCKTKRISIEVIFPKTRPPLRLFLEESRRKRTIPLSESIKKQLPDGRWRVIWEKPRPRLHEIYVLRWIW